MHEISGKEQLTIYLVKISFGLNIHIWSKCWENMLKLETSLQDGWNGFLDKKHGWLI